jgi:uncharacterized MAPEG superfamily protein
MKLEMYLVLAVALTVVQMLVAATGVYMQVGLMKLVGNREGMPEITGWRGRAERAHLNMLQNLVLFAALVLVAIATSKVNETILLGAQIFFWSRVAYALIYLAGIPWLRTLSWVVSIVGLIMMFMQLVK